MLKSNLAHSTEAESLQSSTLGNGALATTPHSLASCTQKQEFIQPEKAVADDYHSSPSPEPQGDMSAPRKSYNKPLLQKLIHGDCLDVLKTIQDCSVDLLVTDIPYGISFKNQSWDKEVPGVSIFKECYRVMKPGAFFFTTFTPRMDRICAAVFNLQEAGFQTDFSFLGWCYAVGAPKPINISKAIDKKLGIKAQIIGHNKVIDFNCSGAGFRNNIHEKHRYRIIPITAPSSPGAKKFEGTYGGCQLKPALEPILVAMKPRSEKTYVEQALKNGKGITRIDNCRIPYGKGEKTPMRDFTKQKPSAGAQMPKSIGREWVGHDNGRFPSNLLVCDNMLGEKSKFFDLDRWFEEGLKKLPKEAQETFPAMYIPKPSPKEKNAGIGGQGEDHNIHLTTKPVKLMNWLITLGSDQGDLICDPFMGSGTTLVSAAMLDRAFIGIERKKEYFEIAQQRVKHALFRK